MYDRTGLSTKCTLIKTGFKNLRTGTEAEFRPFVDALVCVSYHILIKVMKQPFLNSTITKGQTSKAPEHPSQRRN